MFGDYRKLAKSQKDSVAATIVVVCAVVALAFQNPYEKSATTIAISSTVVVLGSTPFILWLRAPHRDPMPLMAFYAFTTAITYGVAGFLIPERYIGNIRASELAYTTALLITLISLMITLASYRLTRTLFEPRKSRNTKLSHHVPMLDSFVVRVSFPIVIVSKAIVGLAGISILSAPTGVLYNLVMAWLLYGMFRGSFQGVNRAIALYIATPYFVLSTILVVLSGTLFSLATLGLAAGLAYTAARGRFPMLPLVALVLLALFLQNGKRSFRMEVWYQERHLSLLERVDLFITASSQSVDATGSFWQALHNGYTRYNHLHLTAAVVETVPAKKPYWAGTSYLPILTKWIPRIVWSDKPREDIGNSWAKPFGWIGKRDYVTSLNLPWIPEMWLNFGWFGVIGVSLLLGTTFASLWHVYLREAASSNEKFAVAYAVVGPLMLPQESNLSIAVGQTMIAIVVVWCFVALSHKLVRSRRPRPHEEGGFSGSSPSTRSLRLPTRSLRLRTSE